MSKSYFIHYWKHNSWLICSVLFKCITFKQCTFKLALSDFPTFLKSATMEHKVIYLLTVYVHATKQRSCKVAEQCWHTGCLLVVDFIMVRVHVLLYVCLSFSWCHICQETRNITCITLSTIKNTAPLSFLHFSLCPRFDIVFTQNPVVTRQIKYVTYYLQMWSLTIISIRTLNLFGRLAKEREV